MFDPSTTRILEPPPCPAPVPETTAAALPMAILGTCTLLVTTLGLYVALCVAIFAVF